MLSRVIGIPYPILMVVGGLGLGLLPGAPGVVLHRAGGGHHQPHREHGETLDRLRNAYIFRKRRFAARAGRIDDDGYEEQSVAYQRTLREVLEAQRRAVIELRNRGEISNDVMHQIERELDLEDSRLDVPRVADGRRSSCG